MTDADVRDRIDRLESLVERQHDRLERQRETIDRQRERIADLEAESDDAGSDDADDHESESDPDAGSGDRPDGDGNGDEDGRRLGGIDPPVTRRSALKAGGLLGLLGLGAETVAADPQGQVGTSADPLKALYTERLRGGVTTGDGGTETTVSNLAGRNLSVNADGDLEATDTRTDVSDDGTTVAGDVEDVDFGANLDVTDPDGGDGSVTVDADVQGATNWEESDGDDRLETVPGYAGVDVGDVRTEALEVGGERLTRLTGAGLIRAGSDLIAYLGDGLGFDIADRIEVRPGEVTHYHSDLFGVGPDDHHPKDHDHSGADVSPVPVAGLDTPFPDLATLFTDDFTITAGDAIDLGGNTLYGDFVLAESNDLTLQGNLVTLLSDLDTNGQSIVNGEGDVTIGDDLVPDNDDAHKLGRGNDPDSIAINERRWVEAWITNGTIRSSDARLKRNVTDLSDGLDRLLGIRPVSYEWTDRDDPDQRLGFLARELEAVVPEAVHHPDGDGYLGVNYATVVPVAVDAVRTQLERVDDLESENERLRDRHDDLETLVDHLESRADADRRSHQQEATHD